MEMNTLPISCFISTRRDLTVVYEVGNFKFPSQVTAEQSEVCHELICGREFFSWKSWRNFRASEKLQLQKRWHSSSYVVFWLFSLLPLHHLKKEKFSWNSSKLRGVLHGQTQTDGDQITIIASGMELLAMQKVIWLLD